MTDYRQFKILEKSACFALHAACFYSETGRCRLRETCVRQSETRFALGALLFTTEACTSM